MKLGMIYRYNPDVDNAPRMGLHGGEEGRDMMLPGG